MSKQRHLPVQGAYNVRDLGGYTTGSGAVVPWRRFLRSDSLHRIEPNEVQRLHADGLRAVVDLRTANEVAQAPNLFASSPDVHFANLPLFDDLSPQALSQVTSVDDHPLFSFYLSALETRGTAICAIFAQFAKVEHGAVLFNCTAGKDRTGIIAALLLGLADVSRDQIIADYVMTADLIPDLVAEFLDISRARGGDTESYARLLESPAATIAAILDRIEDRFGTIPDYLLAIGVPSDELETLRNRLTVD